MRSSALLVVLGLVAPATASAQPASTSVTATTSVEEEEPEERVPTLDLGAFVGVHVFPEDIELGNSWATEQAPQTGVVLGGRVGWTFLPDLARASSLDPQLGLEGELALALATTGQSVEGGRDSYFSPVFGWRAHAIFRLRTAGALHPHLVAGIGGESVVSSSPFMWNDTDFAFHWGPGLTWRASRAWMARLDLRHELTAGRMDDVVSTFELHLGVERSFDLGGGEEPPLPPPAPPPPPPPPPAAVDTDGDGIFDDKDRCVKEAEDLDQFEDEDGCPEPDNDKDGIRDGLDQCKEIAEDADQFQDEDGCPDLDDDGDGILDASDTCRLEPESLNGFQDSDGCPDELPAVVKQFTGAIAGINFAYGRAQITKPSKRLLNKAASVLREYPDLRVRVEGHSDSKGNYDKNKSLSLKRAEAVKWYLVDQGIGAERIETAGMGPDKPRASNKTKKGRAQNRRIEFHLVVNPNPEAPTVTQPTGTEPPPPPPPPASQPSPTPAPTP